MYFPWSQRLVRILDKPDFRRVRTNRNGYKLLPEEQEQLLTQRIGIVGLSSGRMAA